MRTLVMEAVRWADADGDGGAGQVARGDIEEALLRAVHLDREVQGRRPSCGRAAPTLRYGWG